MAKTYFKRKKERELRKGKTIEQIHAEAARSLAEAKKQLQELKRERSR